MNRLTIWLVCIRLDSLFSSSLVDVVLTYFKDIDEEIERERTHYIERMVHEEAGRSNDYINSRLHHSVDEVIPLSENRQSSSLLYNEILNYEKEIEEEKEGGDLPARIRGIDMSRYDNVSRVESPNDPYMFSTLYSNLGYAMIHDRNMNLLEQNEDQYKQLQNHNLNVLSNIEQEYEGEILRKRQLVEDVNEGRKKKQVTEVKPVNDYLTDKWKDSIKSIVDLGLRLSQIPE